ncbi:zinc finger protein 493-like [Littorina saxatilis]|uniref:zinc finger protein 493-like n=1 Tax=Littorina saxatilis TaxID=31220 RepID=UPI0038B5D407
MAGSQGCSVCHRQIQITDTVSHRKIRLAFQTEIGVCSELCEQRFRYWAGFVHGIVLLEVLQNLSRDSTCLNCDENDTASPSFDAGKGSYSQSNSPSIDTFVKRGPQGGPHDDVSDIKVFFDAENNNGGQVSKSLSAASCTSLKVFTGRHKADEGEVVNSFQIETQNSSEHEHERHIDLSHEKEMFECEKCGSRFSTKAHLVDHVERVHIVSNSEQGCFDCNENDDHSHTKDHADENFAGKCNQKEEESKRRQFMCHQCRKEFSSEKGLRCHTQLSHRKLATHKCVVCGLSFKTQIQLKRHRISSHRDKQFENAEKTYGCDQCSKKYASRRTLLHHIHFIHSKQMPLGCKVCGKMYRTSRLVKEHMRTVHRVRMKKKSTGETLLQCIFCSETFTECAKQHIADHLREVHITEMAPSLCCNLCGNKFRRKFTLNYHMRNTHSIVDGDTKHQLEKEKTHPCEKCGKTLSKNSLRRHMLMFHSKHVPTECKVCGKNLQSTLHLERHMRCHSNRPPRVCHVCGVNFKSDQGLASHLAAHKGVKSHICEVCGASFVRRTSWQRHIRQHSDTVFQCDVCSKDFSTDYALHAHMLSRHQRGVYFNNRLKTVQELGYTLDTEAVNRHLNNQCIICSHTLIDTTCPQHPDNHMLVFTCNKCQMNFKHIEVFCHHLKTHKDPAKSPGASRRNYTMSICGAERGEAVMAYACNICHKSFQRREYVSHHMKQHREKSFSCPVCDKTFTYKCNMKNHLLTHSADKPFKCDVCQKAFRRQSLLKSHARVHDPNRSPFRCVICGKGLTRKQYTCSSTTGWCILTCK